VVSKPRIARSKRDRRFADWAPTVVLEDWHRSGVHTYYFGRLRIHEIRSLERRHNELSKVEEEFANQALV
jgi:hypothetical protein